MIGWLALLMSCAGSPPPAAPAVCDAGDTAWVHRVFPLMWGRRAHRAAEVQMWTAAVEQVGRSAVIEAMSRDPMYRTHWKEALSDALQVARTGDRAALRCYSSGLLEGDEGELARFLGQQAAREGAAYAAPFNMADVMESALAADRLAVIWRANLFARMSAPLLGANVGLLELEENRRISFGESFFQTYLHRDLTCLPCHNAEGSVSPAAPLPGNVEAGLWGTATGVPAPQAYQPFRYMGVVGGDVQPWGMSSLCGTFTAPDALPNDALGHSGFFIDDLGPTGSVWDVEASLWAGVGAVEAEGLSVSSGGAVDPTAGFAHLLARTIADQVWFEATGTRLTLAHHLPRNSAQQERLSGFADVLAKSGFSLRSLLVAVAEDPYFNPGLPETCGAKPQGMAPVFDPFRSHNGPADRTRRHPARVLIRSAHDALQWPEASPFPANGDPMLTLQAELGAFLRDAQPGFEGTDFQSVLAFEQSYGRCDAPPRNTAAGDGCDATPAVPGCGSCTCEECVCASDPYCCTVQWDDLCVDVCTEDCGGCGGQDLSGDAIHQILQRAAVQGATVEMAAAALKDRIFARGDIDAGGDEGALIEALLETSLDAPVVDATRLESGLRLLCGAWLLSPDSMLSLEQSAQPVLPALAIGVAEDCATLEALLPEVRCAVSTD